MSRSSTPRHPVTTTHRLQLETDEKEEVTPMEQLPISTTLVIDGKPYVVEHRTVCYDPAKRNFLVGSTPQTAKR